MNGQIHEKTRVVTALLALHSNQCITNDCCQLATSGNKKEIYRKHYRSDVCYT